MKARTILAFFGAALLASSCADRKIARRESYMQGVYTTLRDSLNGADVTLMNDSVKVLFPRNVIFDFDKAIVREDFIPTLSRFAQVMNVRAGTGILIVGHTDSVGGDNLYNLALSRRRADSARAVLNFFGVEDHRLDAWGLGAKMPVATNATEEGRQLNRRVEFVVLYNYKKDSLLTVK